MNGRTDLVVALLFTQEPLSDHLPQTTHSVTHFVEHGTELVNTVVVSTRLDKVYAPLDGVDHGLGAEVQRCAAGGVVIGLVAFEQQEALPKQRSGAAGDGRAMVTDAS